MDNLTEVPVTDPIKMAEVLYGGNSKQCSIRFTRNVYM